MSDVILSDDEILKAIKGFHKWELKKGVLYCFGINPAGFNWNDPDGQNSNAMRVYNWCCSVLNGHEEYPFNKNWNESCKP